jgi:hypothetical protein
VIPEVGAFVLFCINESPEVWRPMLVVSTRGAEISGELFLDFELDKGSAWARRLFYMLDKDSRAQWVSRAAAGRRLGNYRPLPAPILRHKPVPLSKVRGVSR